MMVKNLDYIQTLSVKDILQFYEIQGDAIAYFKGNKSEEYADIMATKEKFLSVLRDIDLSIEECKYHHVDFSKTYLEHGLS